MITIQVVINSYTYSLLSTHISSTPHINKTAKEKRRSVVAVEEKKRGNGGS